MMMLVLAMVVPESKRDLIDRMVKTAVSFLEAFGPVERGARSNIRAPDEKGGEDEVGGIVELKTAGDGNAAERVAQVEALLRAMLKAASLRQGKAHVYLREEEP
jgi:hypothetical protein